MSGFNIIRSFPGVVSLNNPFIKYSQVANSGFFTSDSYGAQIDFTASKFLDEVHAHKLPSSASTGRIGTVYPPPNAIARVLLSEISFDNKESKKKVKLLDLIEENGTKGKLSTNNFYRIITKFPKKNRVIGAVFAGLLKSNDWNEACVKFAQFIIINELVNDYLLTGRNVTIGDLADNGHVHILTTAYERYHDVNFEINDYTISLAGLLMSSVPENVKYFKRWTRNTENSLYVNIINSVNQVDEFLYDSDTLTVGRSFHDLEFIPENMSAKILTDTYDRDGSIILDAYKNKCYLESNHLKIFVNQSLRDELIFNGDSRNFPIVSIDGKPFNTSISQLENIAIATDNFITANREDISGELIHYVGRFAKEIDLTWTNRVSALLFILMVENKSRKNGYTINNATISTILKTFRTMTVSDTMTDINTIGHMAKIYSDSKGTIPLNFILNSINNSTRKI